MSSVLKKYATHPQFSRSYKEILGNIANVNNEFLFDSLKDYALDTLSKNELPNNLLKNLDLESRDKYLYKLTKISRLRRMSECGYGLNPDDVLFLLLRARSKKEAEMILESYPIPFSYKSILDGSHRIHTRYAGEISVKYNLATSVDWLKIGINDSPPSAYSPYSENDLKILNAIIRDESYGKYIDTQLVNGLKYLMFSVSELGCKELVKLNLEYNKKNIIKSETSDPLRRIVYFNFLCLLRYYSKKHGIEHKGYNSLVKLYDKLYLFKSYRDPSKVITLNSILELHTAKLLAVYARKLDRDDYSYVMNYSGITTELTNRVDLEISTVIDIVKQDYVYKLSGKTGNDSIDTIRYNNFNEAVFNIKSKVASENFYKLIPYLILKPSPQSLTFSKNLGFRVLINKEEIDKLQILYNSINKDNYDMFSEKELTSIRKRIIYTYRRKFNFRDGIFEPNNNNTHTKYITLNSSGKYFYYYYNYYDILCKAKSLLDIEKIILVAGSFNGSETADYNLKKLKNVRVVELIFEVVDNYSIEETKVAIVMIKDWKDSIAKFRKMISLL